MYKICFVFEMLQCNLRFLMALEVSKVVLWLVMPLAVRR
jgi:hypothetical protein